VDESIHYANVAGRKDIMDISGNHELVRQNDNFVPETVIIIGNGLIENGWRLVGETLDEMALASEEFPIQPRKLGTAESLAYFASQGRLAKGLIIRELISVVNGSATNFEEMEKAFVMYRGVCQVFRKALGKVYAASATLSIREDTLEALKEFGLEDSSSGVITTNWDNLLWDYKSSSLQSLIHLYGRCSSWETLLFPTETSEESSNFLIMAKDLEDRFKKSDLKDSVKENSMDLLRKAFDPPKNETEYWQSFQVHLGYAHGRSLKWLREAKRLVICGSSIHPYDHELLSILSDKKVGDAPEKWDEVIVINTSEEEWQKIGGLLKVEPEVCHFINVGGWGDWIGSFLK
jgi:hypothetical protein